MKGKLFVIEGLDGSGKTTQLALLEKRFADAGVKARFISFPDYEEPSSALVTMYLNGDFGDKAADVNAYAASSFYAVDRYASYKKFWEKDYLDGGIIISARYTTSNALHQMGKLPREQWDGYLDWLTEYEYGLLELPEPDLVLLLDMDPELSDQLLTGRYQGDEKKRDIHEHMSYLIQCRESAHYAAEKLGFFVIPVNRGRTLLTREEVAEQVWAAVREKLEDD